MKGADGHEWMVFIVIDLLGRLMLLSGNAAVLSSSVAALGRHLSLCGSSIFLVTYFYRMYNNSKFESAATQHLDFAASCFEAFGSVSFAIAKYLVYNGNNFMIWLYITGGVIFFIGGLLNAVNIYKIQQMKGSQDTRKGGGLRQSCN